MGFSSGPIGGGGVKKCSMGQARFRPSAAVKRAGGFGSDISQNELSAGKFRDDAGEKAGGFFFPGFDRPRGGAGEVQGLILCGRNIGPRKKA